MPEMAVPIGPATLAEIYGGTADELPLDPDEWETRAAAVLQPGPFDYIAGGAGGVECRSEHRTRPAHWFQQLVEQHHRCDLACHFQQVNRESKPVQGLIGQDVGGGPRGVTKYDEVIADKGLGVDASDYVKEVERASEPSFRARRHLCGPID